MPDYTPTRAWLAAWAAGAASPGSIGSALTPFDLVAAARHEGVVVLVHWQLQQARREPGHSSIPEAVLQAFAVAARTDAMVSMLFEAESRSVLNAMTAAGIPGLLLKGSALAYWAYSAPHLRACSDVDLLVPSREAAELLAGRLCHAGLERSETSGDLVAYELMCRRRISEELLLEVDVHWRLANSPLFADAFTFDELMAESILLPRLGPLARGLGLVHACIHACVHRALNLSIGVDDKLKWLYDLEVLMALFKPSDWQQLTALSISKGLAGVVLNALEVSATTFGRELPGALTTALRHAELAEPLAARNLSDWRYMQRKTFKALPTVSLRLRWLCQRVFPSRDYLVCLYGGERRSYLALLAERFNRALQRVSN